MVGLLNNSYLFFLIGVLLGVYLGNKEIRSKVNSMIDKFIFKKGIKSIKPTYEGQNQSPPKKKTIVVNGIKYTEDDKQD